MKNRTTGIFGLLGLLALSFVVTQPVQAEDGVVIYRAKGQSGRFAIAKKSAMRSSYSYTQQAYQGTTIYYGEGTNLDPNVYSSRVVSFYVTFENPTVIHAGHGYADVNADKRDARIIRRRILR